MSKRLSAQDVVVAMAWGSPEHARDVLAAFGGVNRLDGQGYAPIHRACSHGLVDVLHALLRSGADVDRREAHGWTPLHRAILQEDVAMACELIIFGADVNAMGLNDDPRSPLLMAAFNRPMLALLVAAGAGLPKPAANGFVTTIAGGIDARVSPDEVKQARHVLETARQHFLEKAIKPAPRLAF
ncbi:MAG TPA: hypothetical protein DCW68_01450 [Rhodospirillaceae bacterium]|nr:MAG: hypothetical protein A2018_04415 [Alphaproteobacteria bacterium GWF2_58_20]HAU28763.1 hypothetical protein [Rhodospirillaceae bacterium]